MLCSCFAFMFITAIDITYTYTFIQNEKVIDSFLSFMSLGELTLTTCLTSLSFFICELELNYIFFT